MELKASSPKPESAVPSDCASDPEEKEVSDDDDDDRNHKHRRKDDHSQSLERDVLDPVINRSFRKRNKNFGNRHPFRENESMAFETLKTYSDATTDKDFYSKFERRRHGMTSVPRTPFDMNQRLRPSQSFAGDPGAGRGRGRDSGYWNQRESRFSSIDVASQMVQQGSFPPALYTGRGLPNISNAQNASWNAFGLIPAVPNGGLDMLHPMGLQGALRPPINSSLNANIPRQRCRDFEERGFCLRGDMCPMEHGVNRIVIEDVQSLSQFNLPVSLSSAHLIGAHAGSGSLHSVNGSTASMNSKCKPGIISKSVVSDVGLPMDGEYPGPGCTSGADLYDPDQPLWNDRGLESSSALLNMQSSKIDDAEPMSSDAPNSVCPVEATRTSVSLQGASSSVWGRIGSSKSRFDTKEKSNPTMSSFNFPDNQLKEDNDELIGSHSASSQVKQIIAADDAIPRALEASLKAQADMRNIRKPSQKALRTLFVNGIPHKINRRESLLAHFQKFGEVTDIHIPINSERAFIQFSKREEAEAALKAPDAVMGNRFIKLWWANRDCIRSDNSTACGNGATVTPRGHPPTFVLSHPVTTDRRKDIHQPDASKTMFEGSSPSDLPKPFIADAPKVAPPLQKKLEGLEHLKEQLRMKQEILDQKRNEFKRRLNKFEKHATGPKGDVVTEKSAKRLKTSIASDVVKLASPQSSDADIGMPSPHAETTVDKNKQLVKTASQSPKANTPMRPQEPTGLRQSIQPLGPVNRYKLDNRPTAFRIIPPLPIGLANVAALKEHFLPYGELSAVELEDVQVNDSSEQEARLNFTTRGAAEQAFIKGKCWKDHNLKFVWLAPTNSGNGNATVSRERSLSAPPREPLDTEGQSEEKLGNSVNHESTVSDGEHKCSETKSPLGLTKKEPLDTEGQSEEKLGNSVNHESTVSDGEHKYSETKSPLGLTKKEQDEDLQCTTSRVSSAKQSPKDNVC